MVKILKRAINAFLDRPRRDCHALKDAPIKRLQERAQQLEIRPPLFDRLRREQQVCFLLGAKFRYLGFLLDTGMGKTLLSLALYRYFNKLGKVKKALVLVPTRTNKTEWAREIIKHQDEGRLPEDFKYLILRGSSTAKWEAIDKSDANVVVETYMGFARLISKMVEHPKKKNKFKLRPDNKLVRRCQKTFQGLILDESTHIKNQRAIAARICRQLRKTMYFLFPMTGTPFGRDPTDLWFQFYLIDQGQTLGETLGLFRAAFFNEKENPFGFPTHTFDKTKQKMLNRFIAHSSISYEVDESDLPPVIEVKKYVTLPMDADAYYEAAKKELRQAKGNFKEQKNAFLRMRQISSGYMGYRNDELSKRAEFEFSYNPKRELLLSLLENINPRYKTIVFVEFVFSGSTICRELDTMGIKYARLWGGTKDPDAERSKWEDDPEVQHLILNNQMGSFGLNLQLARYGFFYESPVSPITRKQARRRFERQGSLHEKVFLYDLIVEDTMDEAILAWHREGKDLFDGIVRGEVKI